MTTKRCENCETECDDKLCSACKWLEYCRTEPNPSWDKGLKDMARCGVVNRRWQMRFNRGEL